MLKQQGSKSIVLIDPKQSDWPVFKGVAISVTGEDVQQREFSYATSGDINVYPHGGDQSSNN